MPILNGKLKKLQPFVSPTAVLGLFAWMLLEVHSLRVDLTKYTTKYIVDQTNLAKAVEDEKKERKESAHGIVKLITRVDEDAEKRHDKTMKMLGDMDDKITEIYGSSIILEKDGESFARRIDQNREDIRQCCNR